MLAVRFCIRNTPGYSPCKKKRMRAYLVGPCNTNYDSSRSAIFIMTREEYEECTGDDVAAFSHKQGGGVCCGEFLMGKMIDSSKAPVSGKRMGKCYRYRSRDRMRADAERKNHLSRMRAKHCNALQ